MTFFAKFEINQFQMEDFDKFPNDIERSFIIQEMKIKTAIQIARKEITTEIRKHEFPISYSLCNDEYITCEDELKQIANILKSELETRALKVELIEDYMGDRPSLIAIWFRINLK